LKKISIIQQDPKKKIIKIMRIKIEIEHKLKDYYKFLIKG